MTPMSDVVAVGLITAGSSLIAAAISGVITYTIAKHGKESAVATAESQNEVELAKIEAENTRLRAQYTEDERRNKQATYHKTVTVLQRLYGVEQSEELNREWLHCLAGVQIFGSKETSNALEDVRRELLDMPEEEDGDNTAWQERFAKAALGFNDAVRVDIGTDPPTDGSPAEISPVAAAPPDGASP
jgi:hypothetical protein